MSDDEKKKPAIDANVQAPGRPTAGEAIRNSTSAFTRMCDLIDEHVPSPDARREILQAIDIYRRACTAELVAILMEGR